LEVLRVRLAYLHQYFVTPAMAGGTRSYEWGVRLAKSGHEVHMITTDRRLGAVHRQTNEDGISVHWLPVRYENSMSPSRRLLAFTEFALRAGRLARSLKPDLVFATSTPLTVALPAIQAIARTSVPMVFEVRDLWPEVPLAMGALRQPGAATLARALERLAYRNSTRIVTLSEEMQNGVVAAGYPASSISVIPNGADITLFRYREADGAAFRAEHAWLQNRPLVVYTGTLGRVNRVDDLARVAAAVRPLDPEVRFLVVGTGSEEPVVRATAGELGVLDETFFIHAPVPKAEIPKVLAAADLATSLVADIPGIRGESANKVFDALAAGRPVAVNSPSSLTDTLLGSGAGLLLDRDPRIAAQALVEFLGDSERYQRARQASVELADEHYSRDRLFEVFERLLESAVEEGRVARRLRSRTPGSQARTSLAQSMR
jgi:glycosyltransferase involved in cell wall biosynthesis